MGVRANTLGEINMHTLLPFTTDNSTCASPFRCAEYALKNPK